MTYHMMLLRNLLMPFSLTIFASIIGYYAIGGSHWYWILGVWLASVPVVIWWNWQYVQPRSKADAAPSDRQATGLQSHGGALTPAHETTCHEVENRLSKNPEISRD
jgi:hypothetical protein